MSYLNFLIISRDVYSGSETTDEFKCQYYEYDKFQKICHLFNTTRVFDLSSCQKIGGPSCPKYDRCVTWFTSKSTNQEQSCKVRFTKDEFVKGPKDKTFFDLQNFFLVFQEQRVSSSFGTVGWFPRCLGHSVVPTELLQIITLQVLCIWHQNFCLQSLQVWLLAQYFCT